MNFLLFRRNLISFVCFLLFSIPFLLGTIWQFRTNPVISQFSLIDHIVNGNSSSFSGFLQIFVSLSLIASPIALITILEFFRSNDSLKNRLLSTSLGRIYFSKGHKFADIWYFALELIFNKFPQIVTFLTLGIVIFNSKVSDWFSNLYTNSFNIPSYRGVSLIIFLTALLVSNFSSYLNHRIAHNIPFLWDLHELHHSPTEMTMLSKDRSTPFDGIFFQTVSLPLDVFCSLLIAHYMKEGFILPLIIYILFFCLDGIHSTVGHSSFELTYPKPFNYILMSPSLHWIHHSTNPKHFRSNYGNTLCIWDRIFNTYLDETNIQNIKSYGFKNSEYNKHHPIYSMMFLPIIKMKKRLVRMSKRLRRKFTYQ